MAIVRCDSGHFYDNGKYEKCPFCERKKQEGNLDRTVFHFQEEDSKTIAQSFNRKPESESIVIERNVAYQGDDEKTVAFYSPVKGNDFVTGWLVSVEGVNQGRDYRLHHGNNRIGRGVQMDVCVLNDQKISQKTHCRIVYEYKQNRFFLVPEAGSLTYMEGKALESERELQSGDCFRLGDSEFEFIAFCRGNRKW